VRRCDAWHPLVTKPLLPCPPLAAPTPHSHPPLPLPSPPPRVQTTTPVVRAPMRAQTVRPLRRATRLLCFLVVVWIAVGSAALALLVELGVEGAHGRRGVSSDRIRCVCGGWAGASREGRGVGCALLVVRGVGLGNGRGVSGGGWGLYVVVDGGGGWCRDTAMSCVHVSLGGCLFFHVLPASPTRYAGAIGAYATTFLDVGVTVLGLAFVAVFCWIFRPYVFRWKGTHVRTAPLAVHMGWWCVCTCGCVRVKGAWVVGIAADDVLVACIVFASFPPPRHVLYGRGWITLPSPLEWSPWVA
jgi:hypothetical protein